MTTTSPQLNFIDSRREMTRTSSSQRTFTNNQPPSSQNHSELTLRSATGMQGLLLAENGSGMVELDVWGGGSGFRTGQNIAPDCVTPRQPILPAERVLERHGTLLTKGASPSRNTAEINQILGKSGRLHPGAAVLPPPGAPRLRKRSTSASATSLQTIALEQAKPRARVEMDLSLESETVVEGGCLQGELHVRIRNPGKGEGPLTLAGGKIRIVAFEGIPHGEKRHTFYQHSALLTAITQSSHVLFTSAEDNDGYCFAREGSHSIPFSMPLPINAASGRAKGPLQARSGVVVRYIAMASFKLRDIKTEHHSIAHFYRNVDVWPYFNPAVVLAPSERPIYSTGAKSLFLGGSGKLKLTVSLHRSTWVAGQRCYAKIVVSNDTNKKVKTLNMSLNRNIIVFRPDARLALGRQDEDVDACQTSTSRKEICRSTLEMGQRGSNGAVTAKGWWTGVDSRCQVELAHFLVIPSDALSIPRGRFVEVVYSLCISAGAGSLSSDVQCSIPIKIINFISIDPPPTFSASDETSMGSIRSTLRPTRSVDAHLGLSSRSRRPSLKHISKTTSQEFWNHGRYKSTGIQSGSPDLLNRSQPMRESTDSLSDSELNCVHDGDESFYLSEKLQRAPATDVDSSVSALSSTDNLTAFDEYADDDAALVTFEDDHNRPFKEQHKPIQSLSLFSNSISKPAKRAWVSSTRPSTQPLGGRSETRVPLTTQAELKRIQPYQAPQSDEFLLSGSVPSTSGHAAPPDTPASYREGCAQPRVGARACERDRERLTPHSSERVESTRPTSTTSSCSAYSSVSPTSMNSRDAQAVISLSSVKSRIAQLEARQITIQSFNHSPIPKVTPSGNRSGKQSNIEVRF